MLIALLALGVIVQLVGITGTDRPSARKTAFIALNVLFAILLWLFLQPPDRRDASATLAVVTPGATPADLRRANRAPVAVRIAARADDALPAYLDLPSLRVAYPQATTLAILGAGLGDTYWHADRSWQIQFEPPQEKLGLRYVNWPRRVNTGDPLVVRGRIKGSPPGAAHLLDPAGDIVERTQIATDGTFLLTGSTRSPGRFLFRIELATASGDIVESQPMPVHVAEPEPIDVLILLSAPSFESRYLKNWAARGGARLALRTAISRDRYREEFVARDAVPLAELGRARVADFDVVVTDQRAWRTLDAIERNAIYAAVEQDGLGLAIMALDPQLPAGDAARFPALLPSITRDVALAVADAAAAASTVTLAAARFSDDLSDERVALRDVTGRPVVAYQPYGAGRVGVTLVADSHTLVTAGHVQQHARYWRTLIHALAPQTVRPGSEMSPALPLVDQRTQLCTFGAPLANRAVIDEDLQVALRPQAYRPGEHCGYWWPDQAGWHTLRMNDLTQHVYVYGPDDWASVRQANATSATQLAAQRTPVASSLDEQRISPVPRWWFAWPLLAVAGLLWLEQKLHDG